MHLISSKKSLTGFAVILLLYVNISLGEAANPHLVQKSRLQIGCKDCHINEPQLKDDDVLITKNRSVDLDEFNLDGVAMCAKCHSSNQEHKMIHMRIDFPVPADMPLGEENDITCITCHYTHGHLSSEEPQASVSFLDRLLNSERLHKSFLLRRNNTNGELCLTCHNPTQGSK